MSFLLTKWRIPLCVALLLSLASCGISKTCLEPSISYMAQTSDLRPLPSSFPPLTQEERGTEWGKELLIAQSLSRELDLYRGITAYKRALVLIPADCQARRQQIEYGIVLCYYLGHKYQDAINAFEESTLLYLPPAFPASENLLTLLYDCYEKVAACDRAASVLDIIERHSPDAALDLRIFTAASRGEIPFLQELLAYSQDSASMHQFLGDYCTQAKSVRKARVLNAILPGAGYLYVGQKQSALTSLILNAVFIATAYQFFDRGLIAPGLIATSLEFGWYIGGINGAGIEAQEYNNRLYERGAIPVMKEERLFPILSFQKVF